MYFSSIIDAKRRTSNMYHKFSTNESLDEQETAENEQEYYVSSEPTVNGTLRKQNSTDSYEHRQAIEAYENKVTLWSFGFSREFLFMIAFW